METLKRKLLEAGFQAFRWNKSSKIELWKTYRDDFDYRIGVVFYEFNTEKRYSVQLVAGKSIIELPHLRQFNKIMELLNLLSGELK